MKPGKKMAFVIFGATLACFAIIYIYVLPIVNRVRTDMDVYATRAANRDNYKLHTTPLPKEVVDNICSKLKIKDSSEHCQPGAIVYAPDFFDDLKTYFKNLPDQDKTYSTVQDKLGAYLVFCEKPDPQGRYVCRYDLRGNHLYPILFFFSKEGYYFQIIANVGGS